MTPQLQNPVFFCGCIVRLTGGECPGPTTMREFIYHVDAKDRITFVDANWVAFAAENGLPTLTAEAVTGKSLWNYISNLTLQHFYKIFMADVRKTSRGITVPFRCDGPECRRFMKLFVLPLTGGAVEFRSVLVREEPRPKIKLLDPDFPRTESLISVCAWCNKVKASDWMEAEDAVHELQFFDQPRLPQITHGICGDCLRTVMLKSRTVKTP